MPRSLALLMVASSVALAPAAESELAFRPSGPGLYQFDTGPFRGTLKLDGKYVGLYPLFDAASGAELTRAPGLFSPYRAFTGNTRFGNVVRDWPVQTRLVADGAVEACWPAAKEHPLAIVAVYRWSAPGTLDVQWTVTPERDMPDFELFLSSYFTKNFRAAVYAAEGGQAPGFLPVDQPPGSRRSYVMYPRDTAALSRIRDGRWLVPPNPVQWADGARLVAPLVLRRDAALDVTAAMMCPPADCFAIASPWNPPTPEARGYRSLYLSLFGRPLKAKQSATARCRLLLGHKLSDADVLARYREYAAGQNGP
jgi:hypothetical protein